MKSTRNILFVVAAALALSACGGGSDGRPAIPRLSVAQGASITACEALTGFTFARTEITAAATVPAGTLSGRQVSEHCRVTGHMNKRTSAVDGQTYAIGFEMRMPKDWNGRFFHQVNGGIDGVVATALGGIGGGPLQTALQVGFAVLSSDAGHSAAQNPMFGMDPQARLDYGYQAVGTLTPMAKALIRAAYGKEADRSYISGTSNGGRHTMVAAARYAAEYDGFFAVSPGFNLPRSSIAQLWGAQQWAKVATNVNDLETAFPAGERRLVADAILARCDALDGLGDGMVNAVEACRTTFSVERDVPSCAGPRNGTCLTTAQKAVLVEVFKGPVNSAGHALYARWPFDPGIVQPGWATWKFRNSVGAARDPVASVLFASPPEPARLANTLDYALTFSLDTDAPKFFATSGIYSESSISFMTPPDPSNLDTLRNRGAKMIVVHGEADGVFSPDDTAAWYDSVDRRYEGEAPAFVRFFRVPGMGHSSGGPSTDQYDGLTAIVNWVERGQAPDRIVAAARGVGNPGGVNADVPSSWAPNRTRPLCVYPLIARYKGGNTEVESSFACEP